MSKGIEIIYWDKDVDDWDFISFESRRASKEAGWVIDEVVNGHYLGYNPRMGTKQVIDISNDPAFPLPARWYWLEWNVIRIIQVIRVEVLIFINECFKKRKKGRV